MDKTLDLDELERVAKRATQARRYRVGPKVYARGHGVPLLTVNDLGPSLGQQDEDATYIATFDPPTILTLIAAARPAVVSDEVVERMCRAHDAVRFGSELSAYVDHQGAAMRAALALLPGGVPDREAIARVIGSYVVYDDKGGPDTEVLQDVIGGDYDESVRRVYELTDAIIAMLSASPKEVR